MPYSIEYIEKDEGLIILWSGDTTSKELVQSYHDRYSPLERFKKLRYVIIDYCQVASFNITPGDIKIAADLSNDIAVHNRGLYAVAVMPTDLGFGMARMFQSYADDDKTGWHTRITRSREEACRWLRSELGEDLTFGNNFY